MISETIVFLLEELFYLYTCYLFFDSFFETVRTNRIVLFLTYLALFVVDGKYLLFDDVMPNPIFNILFFFLITMHYEASYKKRMVMVFLFYASLGAVETVMMTLTSNHLADVQQHGYTNPFGTLFINLICFILVLILRIFKNISAATIPMSIMPNL